MIEQTQTTPFVIVSWPEAGTMYIDASCRTNLGEGDFMYWRNRADYTPFSLVRWAAWHGWVGCDD